MATFAEDSRTTTWLDRMGVQYEYATAVRMDELTPSWNLINHGRPDGHPKEDELIIRYADAQQSGAVFPAPTVHATKEGLEILDGLQRLCAAELNGQTVFNAYIVKTNNPSVLASIRICSNHILNGQAPPQEWTVAKVVDVLCEQHKWSTADCSMWSGFPETTIEKEMRARDGRRWMESVGIDVSLKPANQKGFQEAFSRCVTSEMRQDAVGVVKKIIETCQNLKSNNSEAVGLLELVTDVKKKHGVNIRTQLRSKYDEIVARPEIASRLRQKSSQHPVDNAQRALCGAVTALRSAQKYHADAAQSKCIVDLIQEAKALCKKIVPREHWAATHDIFA